MGEVYIWFPFSEEYTASLTPEDQLHGPVRPTFSCPEGSNSEDTDRTDRDTKWGQVGGSVIRLVEPLPARPDLQASSPDQKGRKQAKDAEWEEWEGQLTSSAKEEGSKVVKIASGADFLVALKGNGEVWACSVRDEQIGAWIYVSLPAYSSHRMTVLTDVSYHGFLDRPSSMSRHNSSGSRHIHPPPPAQKEVSTMPGSTTYTTIPTVLPSNLPHYLHSTIRP